jgi:hypothetical protein
MALLHWRKIDQIPDKTLNEINQQFRDFSLKLSQCNSAKKLPLPFRVFATPQTPGIKIRTRQVVPLHT